MFRDAKQQRKRSFKNNPEFRSRRERDYPTWCCYRIMSSSSSSPKDEFYQAEPLKTRKGGLSTQNSKEKHPKHTKIQKIEGHHFRKT